MTHVYYKEDKLIKEKIHRYTCKHSPDSHPKYYYIEGIGYWLCPAYVSVSMNSDHNAITFNYQRYKSDRYYRSSKLENTDRIISIIHDIIHLVNEDDVLFKTGLDRDFLFIDRDEKAYKRHTVIEEGLFPIVVLRLPQQLRGLSGGQFCTHVSYPSDTVEGSYQRMLTGWREYIRAFREQEGLTVDEALTFMDKLPIAI